ncbi:MULTISPECIES: DUF1120 domain-containing protein [Pseudomonas]|jgi:hypothetical protein|uniref:DUF1120 domain-containing protein n=1 Tax=Pseudomonas azotoformans TaxID=47878 RepID=A0A127HWZ3_PSEAZ|nr:MULTISPECIES: DUF1120 domain-containing protein [Pseudomonas fluorescens group]AMN79063.1 hypothetical protein AYR47_12360 [Pseudomonas azotoformans]ETK15383.1 hypothetical protein H096_27903 [Pseudomonas sp. FH1]
MSGRLQALVTALLVAVAHQAFAASSADLAVRGSITPSACSPTLSASGVVDFAKIAAKDLSADSSTWLPTHILKLHVDCVAPTLFALRGNDNRAGTAHKDDGYGYGLGLINGDQKVGTYLLTLSDPVSDTAAVIPLASMNGGAGWWSFPHGTWLVRHQLAAFGTVESGIAAPIPLLNVTADLHVETSIAPASGLSLTEQVPLDGSATVDVIYL